MTSASLDTLSAIEEQRQSLVENVRLLQTSLQQWQTWEAEYEGIKEEFSHLPPSAVLKDFQDIGKTFNGELVSEKEVQDLIGRDQRIQRTPEQIVGVISRRLEYVQKNLESIQIKLLTAEAELAGLALPSRDGDQQEKSLPFTEIFEELDDDGKVVAGATSRPVDSEKEIWETLKEVGVKPRHSEDSGGLALLDHDDNMRERGTNVRSQSSADYELQSRASDGAHQEQHKDRLQKPIGKGVLRKKSVSFAEGTKDVSEASESNPQTRTGFQHKVFSDRKTDVAMLAKGSFKPSERVVEVDENDNAIGVSNPVVLGDESPNDAALRRELLQYSMNEVGSIVAQLDLEEEESSDYSDEDDDETDLDSANGGDEEYQHGLSMRSGVSDSYRQRMTDLEEKLNAQTFQNLGPQPNQQSSETAQATTTSQSGYEATDKKLTNKTVRFDVDMDGSHEYALSADPRSTHSAAGDLPNAINRKIDEQSEDCTPSPTIPKKLSRFKSGRNAALGPSFPGRVVQKPALGNTRKSSSLVSDIVER